MENNQPKSKRGGARPGSGRPKGSPNKATRDLKELAQVHTPDALRTLATIMKKGQSEAARVAAANSLLDRGYGKAHQTQIIDATVTNHMVMAPPPAKDAEEWAGKHGPH